jgi:hypothetical protein
MTEALPWLNFAQRALANGWTPEQLAALPFSERFDLGTFQPGEPRIPNRQKDVHDLFAGKSYAEIRAMLEQFIGPNARPESAKQNLRRLRRSAGIPVTAVTNFDKVVSRVEEWSHKMLESGAMLENIIQQVTDACAENGIFPGDPYHVEMGSEFAHRLSAIVADNEHIGINAMQRAALCVEPMGIGLELLVEMRGKISQAGQQGGAGFRPPAQLLGQYESYFEVTHLRKLPPETLAQLARSLGLPPAQATAAGIHRKARHRFTQIRQSQDTPCSSSSITPDPTMSPADPDAVTPSGPAAIATPPAAVFGAPTGTFASPGCVAADLWAQL